MKILNKIVRGVRIFVNHANDKEYMTWVLKEKKRLRRFDKKHEGEKCFIIGNGPSLNRMNLSALKDVTCFGLNKIYLHPDFDKMSIDYHVAVNPLVVIQSMSMFQKLECPSFLSYRACENRVRESPLIHFLMTEGGPDRFSASPYDTISEGATVTYVALQLAYFMGFSEVYLIGVDHNFIAAGNPNEKQVLDGPDVNHFHPDYFSGQEWHLPDLEASEIAYRLAKYHYFRHGKMIMDATCDGKLDVFKKIEYETALERCAKT